MMIVHFYDLNENDIAINPDHVVCFEPTDDRTKTVIHLVNGQQRTVNTDFRTVYHALEGIMKMEDKWK